MKKITLLAVCLFTISTAINAQEQEPAKKLRTEKTTGHVKLTPEQRAQKNVDDLNSVAALTDDQKVKVKDLAITRITKADAIRTKYQGQPENKETEHKELDVVKKEYHQALKALLTPEQLEKVKAKDKENKAAKVAANPTETND